MVDVSCWAAAEEAEGKKRCADDCLTFLFRLQRFSAFSAASFRAVGRRRRGKTQKRHKKAYMQIGECVSLLVECRRKRGKTQKRRSNACMTFRPSCSKFSVFQRIQRHHFVQWAAEDAERRRKDTKKLICRLASV